MSDTVKVFKLPDGNGGTRYRIMTPSGEWLDTDESGTPLKEKTAPSPGDMSRKESPARKKSGKARDGVFMSIKMSQEDYDLLTKYIYWSSLQREPISRSGLAYRLLMAHISKDREFQEYRKNSQ